MPNKEVQQALQTLAERNHTTVEDVRKEIAAALAQARANGDPAIQAAWVRIPVLGKRPLWMSLSSIWRIRRRFNPSA